MGSVELPLLKAVEGAAIQCTAGMITEHNQEEHMPAKGTL